jgi:hypothetical protein
MKRSHFQPESCLSLTTLLLFAGMLLIASCGKTVTETVPPTVDLKAYPLIGVIEFTGSPSDLGCDSTQKFMSRIQAAQPGVHLLELGSLEQVLYEVEHVDLDFRAIQSIGRKYGVTAVLSGHVSFSEMRPGFKISSGLNALSAQAMVDGKMSVKIWDAASGATEWTNSSWGSWSMGGVSLNSNGASSAGFKTPEEQRDKILMALIRALDHDLWPTYIKRRM